ncbi:class I SAM-dependent methyltransferase [Mycobacterium yunnanensis]|uniref:class I SAM-dependent methyltransferase n=1 Tax=Mycobacterium yunnanensis TaxID=368477 RepID=UPI0021F25797|nr:methyltransferase [Mycobacterium yunnanensis]
MGAGHGSFTDTVLRAGGAPTVTEMSRASFECLKQRFQGVPDVDVVFDPDGQETTRLGRQYDVVLLISVIHHIPDYVGTVTTICDELLRPGGCVLTFQDPLWYPRQRAYARTISQSAYLAWRLTQGELRRGLATRWRRLRGVYDDTEPSDLVEYHVVRQGVDDHALIDLFERRFETLDVMRYFSTQSPLIQGLGGNRLPPNTFGLLAKGRVAD